MVAASTSYESGDLVTALAAVAGDEWTRIAAIVSRAQPRNDRSDFTRADVLAAFDRAIASLPEDA
jgi:hypothetical protein